MRPELKRVNPSSVSQVVDSNGEPLVVHHGTTADVERFDKLMLGASTGAKSAKQAFFFSSSPIVAAGYASLSPTRAALSDKLIKNAINTGIFSDKMTEFLREQGRSKYGKEALQDGLFWDESGFTGKANILPVFLRLTDPVTVDHGGKEYREQQFSAAIEEARVYDKDGVIYKNSEDSFHKDYAEVSDIYAVFTPEHIKSAISNTGAFNQTDDGIRFSIRNDAARVSTESALQKLAKFLNPLDYSRFRNFAVKNLPHEAVMWVTDVLQSPYWVKEGNSSAAPFYKEAQDREVTKLDNNIRMFGGLVENNGTRTTLEKLKSLGRWSDVTTVWGKMRQEYDKLTDQQKAAYDVIRFEGDAYNKTYETLANALRNRTIKKAGVDAAVFAFYRKALAAEDASFEEKLKIAAENMAEAGMSPNDIKGHIAEYRSRYADLKGWVHRDHGEGDHVVRVYHIIDRLDFDIDVVQHKGQEADRIRLPYYAGVELTRAMEQITEQSNGTFKQLRDGAVIMLLPRGAAELALERINALPLQDTQGEYKYRVLAYNRFVSTEAKAEQLADTVRGNYEQAMPRNYYVGHQYETSWSYSNKVTEADFQELRTSDMKMELILSQAIDKAAKREGLDEKTSEEIHKALVQNTAEILLGRGAGLYQIRRANYLIEGYELDNAIKKYEDYINGVAGLFSKARYALRQYKHMQKVSAKLRSWATRYVTDTLRNMGAADRMSGNVRATVSLWFLGCNATWMLVNSTQPLVVGQAELSRYTKGAARKVALAEKDVVTDNLTADEKSILQEHATITQDRDSMMADITGTTEGVGGKVSKALHGAVQVSMALGQKVEVLNRHTMIIAAYRVFRNEKNLPRDAAYLKALEVNSATNIDMGRYNLPRWARNPYGRTMYALQSYIQHMLNYMYHRSTSGKRHDQKAVLRLLFAMFLMGGLPAGAPGSDELDKMIQQIWGYSPKMALQGFIHRYAKQYDTLGEMLEGFVWHGVPGALKPFGIGFSLTNSVQFRIPFLSSAISGDNMFKSVGGPVAGLMEKGVRSFQAAQRGDVYRAVENAAPTAVANVMSGIRQATEGVRTAHGKTVQFQGKPLKMTPGEAAMRSLGVQPVRTADISEIRGKEKSLITEWHDRRIDALDNYRNSRKLKYVQEFNRDLKNSQANGLVPQITMESINQVMAKPDKNKTRWERRYGVE